MSTLDQAFAKAYGQPAESRKKAEARLPLGARPQAIAEPPRENRVSPPAAPAPAKRMEDVADTAEISPLPQRPLRSTRKTHHGIGKPSRPAPSQEPVPPPAAEERPLPAGSAAVARPPVEAKSPSPRSVRSQFQPQFEVDGFQWPEVVTRLAESAEEPLEQLLTNLVTRSIRGQKVIAWQGSRRGDGCTTLMLTAARRMAERGVKVLLVDAEIHQPRLARHLGLMPTAGWEETLAGRLPLAEVVVESLADRVALLPWCTSEGNSSDAAPPGEPAAALETLRSHYDLVFVDLGRARKSPDDASLVSCGRPWIDAAIIVHHVRKAAQSDLSRAKARLRHAGIADVAIVENFA
jgi:Mrp family chromosome partitioning ATPase